MFESELKMSNREKSQATILIIEPDSNERNNLKNALEEAIKDNAVLLVTGSFYLASEFKKIIKTYS